MNASHSTNLFTNSCHHISTNGKTLPHNSSMWYLYCILEHCTFVSYACALSELVISRFSAILSFCMNNRVRIGARYNKTLLLKLHTHTSSVALANQCANFASVRKETVLNTNWLRHTTLAQTAKRNVLFELLSNFVRRREATQQKV